jgi:hypothetical protein
MYDDYLTNHSFNKFTSLVSRGHLVKASNDVFKLVKYFYAIFLANKGKLNFCSKKYVLQACMHFRNSSLFETHRFNGELGDESHKTQLIKLIGGLFFKTLCFSFAREKTLLVNRSNLGIRQKLNKIVLFQHV